MPNKGTGTAQRGRYAEQKIAKKNGAAWTRRYIEQRLGNEEKQSGGAAWRSRVAAQLGRYAEQKDATPNKNCKKITAQRGRYAEQKTLRRTKRRYAEQKIAKMNGAAWTIRRTNEERLLIFKNLKIWKYKEKLNSTIPTVWHGW